MMIEIGTLVDKLQRLPAEISRVSYQVEEARLKYEQKVAEFKVEEAKKTLSLKAEYPKITLPELKARVIQDTGIYGLHLACIESESEYRKKEVMRTELENHFVSLRKVAEIKIKELNIGG